MGVYLSHILHNKVIIASFLAWFVAQLIKIVTEAIMKKEVGIDRITGAGGMPSSHASYVSALATSVLKIKGAESAEFGIALAIAIVVMYDAAGVRAAAGNQAKLLNQLIFSRVVQYDKKLKELLGHTPIEVVAGAFLGIVIGLVI